MLLKTTKMTSKENSTVEGWKAIEDDDFFSQFLNSNADENDKTKLAVSQALSVTEQLAKLTEGITLLDKEVRSQVLQNHADLVFQATWMERLESLITDMHSQIQCVLSGMERLRARIMDPFHQMESHTIVLSRLHDTSDLLRRISRHQQLTRKLQSCQDPIIVAAILNEINQLSDDVDLTGLDILENDIKEVQRRRVQVREESKQLLASGLEDLNREKIKTAIQVLINLGLLEEELTKTIERILATTSKTINEALDLQTLTQSPSQVDTAKRSGGPGRPVMPQLGGMSFFRSKLWVALKNLFENSVYRQCRQVEVLQSVVEAQLDASVGPQHITPESVRQMTLKFWNQLSKLLAQELTNAADNSRHMKQAFEGEFPELLRLFRELCKQLTAVHKQNTLEVCFEAPEGHENLYKLDRHLISPFENAYLSRSLSRLMDPVDQMFSGNTAPTHEKVDDFVRTISSELSVSIVDETLSSTVAKNIKKTVKLFCMKCEQLVSTGGDATQVIDVPSSGQVLNASIANVVYYLRCQVERVLTTFGAAAALPAANIADSLAEVDRMTSTHILGPLMTAIAETIESILLTMHEENFGLEECKAQPSASPYMKELERFISRAATMYLAPFDNQALVNKCAAPVGSRCIELFLRLACLIRPLGAGGRVKLATDFQQIEVAVEPLCGAEKAGDSGVNRQLGRPLRSLRSLRTMLDASPPQMAESPSLGTVLPYSLVLCALFAHGPPDLLSPHVSASWSISRLSQWLDSHPAERDRLELIAGSLQRYQQTVRQANQTQFHPVYPVMVQLLERGMALCTTGTAAKQSP